VSAALAFGFVYAQVVDGLDEDGQLKVDALLGDTDAEAEMHARRRATVMAMGGDIA